MKHIWILLIVGLAFGVRVTYTHLMPESMWLQAADASDFHLMGTYLLTDDIFSWSRTPPLYPDHVRTPLYPYFLATIYALTDFSVLAVVLVQAMLDTLTVAVTFRLGELIGGPRVGLTAAFLYAVSPMAWRFSNQLFSEVLFGLLLVLSLWFLVRYLRRDHRRDIVLFGLFMGLAILCKPNALLVPALLVIVMAHRWLTARASWWQGPVLSAVIILMLLTPWVVRNRVVFGEWFYTTTFDYNLALISAVGTLAHVQNDPVRPWTDRWWEIYILEVYEQAYAQTDYHTCNAHREVCKDDIRMADLAARATQVIRQHPTDFVLSHVKGWARAFIPREHRVWYEDLTGQPWDSIPNRGGGISEARAALSQGDVVGAGQVLIERQILALPPLAASLRTGWLVTYFGLMALSLIGAWRLRPWAVLLVFGVTIFYLTFLPGPITYVRFWLPIIPLGLILAAVGVWGPRRL